MSDQSLVMNARDEYIAQLADALSPTVFEYIDGAYMFALGHGKNRLKVFQTRLRDVQFWNSAQISSTVNRILGLAPYLSDLIAATIVAHVKVLSSIKMTDSKRSIRLKLPSTDAFVHRVFINYAKILYESPRMWGTSNPMERMEILKRSVSRSVRDVLPTSDILRSYLGGSVAADGTLTPIAEAAEKRDEDDDDEEDDDADDDDDDDTTSRLSTQQAPLFGGQPASPNPVTDEPQGAVPSPAPFAPQPGLQQATPDAQPGGDLTATQILKSVQVGPPMQPQAPVPPQPTNPPEIDDFGGDDDW